MLVKLKYGDRKVAIKIPTKAKVSILEPARLPVLESVEDALEKALEKPIGCERLEELLHRNKPAKIAIAVPDETRPAPVKKLLPVILNRIYSALPGLDPSAVTVVIGGGLHPPLDREGRDRVIPPAMAPGCRVVAHDAERAEMVDFGVTRRGTPVRINAHIAAADYKIVIGQIDPHQFVGFTGGSKGVTIGCASAESIEHNHSLMFDENAQVGCLDGNPVREDLNEAGEMIRLDLAINVILDADKNAVRLLAGKPVAVLREGARTCADLYGVAIENKFDIVVASCGGYPKDICLYQAQKGLNLASQAVKPGGNILLLAASPQGVGDDIYFDYVSQFTTPEDVLEDFKKLGFKMGAHKAYLFGRTLTHYDVAVFSDLDPGILRKCHLRAADPTEVISEWVQGFKGPPRVAVIPNANTTYFYHK
jgi:nickel-dependent lactate racemase